MKNDPVLFKKIGKNKLHIHSSHQLPNYLQQFPFYDRALPRICKELKNIDKKLEVIDVGANVGDTISLISEQVKGNFLCVEGDKKYLPLLKKNIALLTNSYIEVEENYCAESSLDNFFVKNQNGTARLIPNPKKTKNQINNFKSLDKIIKSHPKFENANLLKIDTDGYEINVLKSGKEFISKSFPIIFLEFTPKAYEDLGQSYEDLLETLISYGYSKALFYDNFGVPVQIETLDNSKSITNLISRIDNKNLYYYDLLLINKNNYKKYKNLFTSEILSHTQQSKKIYQETLDKFNQQKLIAESHYVKLEKQSVELMTVNLELKKINEENKYLKHSLQRIQSTKFWMLAEKIRSLKKIFLLKFYLQECIKKCFFYLRYKKLNLKKIVYIGHSYHNKTQSTKFLLDYLKEHFEVKVILDETWRGGDIPDLSFIDKTYVGVVFFQMIYPPEVINNIKNKNIIYFPMYDYFRTIEDGFYKKYPDLKIINFSSTLHKKMIKSGVNSLHVKYFPKIKPFSPGDIRKVYFWQRISPIHIDNMSKLFTPKYHSIHLHKAIDPDQIFKDPSLRQMKDFSITFSNWYADKNKMLKDVNQCGIYVAPREYEGIGLSFLEAMSMGKAVVALDNPTMNEYIKNNSTGYLFDIRNPKRINFENIELVQKNTYKYMKNGHIEWLLNREKIINFILN